LSDITRWEYKIIEPKDAELSGLNKRAKRPLA
jgi:hypothetical protein